MPGKHFDANGNNNLPGWQDKDEQSGWGKKNGQNDGWRTPSPERNEDEMNFRGQKPRYGMITDPDEDASQRNSALLPVKPSSSWNRTDSDLVGSGSECGKKSETKSGLHRSDSRDSGGHKERSRSRSRERSRNHEKSESRQRSTSRDRHKDRDRGRKRSRSREKEKENRRSRSGSRSRKRARSRSKSPERKSKRSPDDRFA